MLEPLFAIPALTAAMALPYLLLRRAKQRLDLSRAKAPSLGGHVRWARRIARWIPGYSYDAKRWYRVDGASEEVAQTRRAALQALGETLRSSSPTTLAATERAEPLLPDLQFTRRYRVPFQFRDEFLRHVPITAFWQRAQGNLLYDLDDKAYLDLTGSYGLNLLGTGFYQDCVDEGIALTRALGPVLGSYHACVLDNAERLCALSGMDAVSFHMSGTEAVMQAVRLARYHTRRDKVVRFSGAYHGWWDDVQPGPGNPSTPAASTLTLREGHARTLHVLRTRQDVACVLVNPLQAMHVNAAAPSDATLMADEQRSTYDRAAHAHWLRALREVCSQRGIVLIFDEVFMGFRLGARGVQDYFGVQADMVTYGKTLGGGLPVGVVCGKQRWMQRFRTDRPADICFARGTFNAHPYVMGAMNVFLRRLESEPVKAMYADADARWQARMRHINEVLQQAGHPVSFAGMETIWTLRHHVPSRYNWLLQFYLRAQGVALSWVGTGRFIFNLSFSDDDFARFEQSLLQACEQMRAGGWWWTPEGVDAKRIRRGLLWESLGQRLRGAQRAS